MKTLKQSNKLYIKYIVIVSILMAISFISACKEKIVPVTINEQVSVRETSRKKENIRQSTKIQENIPEKDEKKQDIEPTLTEEKVLENKISKLLESMTLEEKIGQMFFVTPEALLDNKPLTKLDEGYMEVYKDYPVGGFILFQANIQNPAQLVELTTQLQEVSMNELEIAPFIGIDEEGGQVARLGNHPEFTVPTFDYMSVIGKGEDDQKAVEIGEKIGAYLNNYGFNVNFAPVADVYSNLENKVVKRRAFSQNPKVVANMAVSVANGLGQQGILATYKHFPGHGGTEGDSHHGYAYSNKSWEELEESELIPFVRAIENNAPFIMVGHISYPNILKDEVPASLSKEMIEEKLITQLEYKGIVITDALNMGAITKAYEADEVAVKAIHCGVDMLLMPEDFKTAYDGVVKALENGEITEERIEISLRKIIGQKLELLDK